MTKGAEEDEMWMRLPRGWVERIERAERCWLWRGSVKKDGYGRIGATVAHRAVYEVLVGGIPEGLELDHLCRVIVCVNPRHLEPVDRLENMRRRYATYTHCKNGHEFTTENTYVMPDGNRSCRTCRNAASLRYKARRRGAL